MKTIPLRQFSNRAEHDRRFFEPGYLNHLSAASRLSLQLQGGRMTAEQAAAFCAGPYAADAGWHSVAGTMPPRKQD